MNYENKYNFDHKTTYVNNRPKQNKIALLTITLDIEQRNLFNLKTDLKSI